MESIFTTASSFVAPLPSPTSTMTPSIMTTTTTASQPPIPPTPIPCEVLQNLLTFEAVFRFEDRVKSLEVNFSEFMRTNQSPEAVSNIPASTPSEPATRSAGRSTIGTQSRQLSASESAFAEELVKTTYQIEEPSHPVFETGAEDQPIVQTSQHPKWFSQPRKPPTPDRQQYPHNLLQPLPLIPDNQGRWVILFEHFINNDLEYLWGGASSRKYTTSVKKTKAIVEWYNYKHLDWISVRRDDDKIYKFKEGNFKRLRLQDIEDMLLLLVQGKQSNLTVEERFAFNVSLRMFTRSIVIQRRVEDLQLGVESYQKRLNLTKPDTYRSDLKRREAYTAYSYPRGFIYQNKDKKNKLMRIDELHKFSDRTLNDVHNALDDHLKGIRMHYLPITIWRKGDKDRAAAMIQAIDKMLKTRRIMRSLERFVVEDSMKETFRCYKGPYDSSYAAPIFTE
nr:hypothetical protein [Tanacetum cinerariifolium]